MLKRIRNLMIVLLVLFSMTGFSQVIRKNWREMTTHEKAVYVAGIRALYNKTPNVITTYVATHANSTYVKHGQLDFLIWHRIFIYYFEKELINSGVAGASNIAIPYWGWETAGDWSSSSPMFSSGTNNLGLFGLPIPEGTFTRGFGQPVVQPTASELQGLSANFTQFGTSTSQQATHFWPRLEVAYHNPFHGFIGGSSGTMSFVSQSPGDPIFYQHHCYVDKIWQDWHNKNGSSSIANQNVLINTVPGQPQMARADLLDGRSLKVWYAYNGQVVIDKYNVSGTENYRYTGEILIGNAASPITNAFTVPASTTCNVISGAVISLKPGFTAANGSVFSAKVDPVSNPSSTFNTGREEMNNETNQNSHLVETFDESKLHAYPNPSEGGKFTIALLSNEDINYTYVVYNAMGEPVFRLHESANDKSFDVDMSEKPVGMYLLHLKNAANGKVYLKKLIKK
jgi:hypothetical protein